MGLRPVAPGDRPARTAGMPGAQGRPPSAGPSGGLAPLPWAPSPEVREWVGWGAKLWGFEEPGEGSAAGALAAPGLESVAISLLRRPEPDPQPSSRRGPPPTFLQVQHRQPPPPGLPQPRLQLPQTEQAGLPCAGGADPEGGQVTGAPVRLLHNLEEGVLVASQGPRHPKQGAAPVASLVQGHQAQGVLWAA